MPSLTLKRVPDEIHERLKERAERHRRSMNSEAIRILERALKPTRMSAEEAIAEAEALNDRIGKTFDSTIIEEKKREGLT
jgi:Arc-like DNA binding domain.